MLIYFILQLISICSNLSCHDSLSFEYKIRNIWRNEKITKLLIFLELLDKYLLRTNCLLKPRILYSLMISSSQNKGDFSSNCLQNRLYLKYISCMSMGMNIGTHSLNKEKGSFQILFCLPAQNQWQFIGRHIYSQAMFSLP